MHSTPRSLQPPGLSVHHNVGRPCPYRRILQNQLQQPPQLRSQSVSLTSSRRSLDRWAASQCSPTRDTGSAASAAAAGATGMLLSDDGSAIQPPLRLLAMRLPSPSSKLRRQQRGFRRRRRADTQVCAAAAVLQPPVAGKTLTQLAARFMARTLLLLCSVSSWRHVAPSNLKQHGGLQI